MSTINLNIKLLSPFSKLPEKKHYNDAAYDLYAYDYEETEDGRIIYNTGLAIKIPDDYVGIIAPRSSVSKLDLFLANSIGIIDSGYTGELLVVFKPNKKKGFITYFLYRLPKSILSRLKCILNPFNNKIYKPTFDNPERVAQLLLLPRYDLTFNIVDDLEESTRGENGFGSTGIK